MIRRTPRSTRTNTLFPYPTPVRSLGVQYARGAETENKNKPDFLFPGPQAYHDDLFPRDRLTMLGAKSTLKDRQPFTREQMVMRSEGHTSELQSLMRISYAVFCLQNISNEYTFICTVEQL